MSPTASSALTDEVVTPPDGLPLAPPPWTLTAECWLFPFWTSSTTLRNNASPPTPSPATSTGMGSSAKAAQKMGLPPGAIHPFEPFPADGGEQGEFKGGLGAWILYRYTESPAGAYDELIYVAGFFTSPDGKRKTPRITNIYVSTTASVWNGRRNWNIPKHVADFEWSSPVHSSSSCEQTVSIRHPKGSPLSTPEQAPFFSASLTPSRFPSVPINTNLSFFPAIPLLQPPLERCTLTSTGGSGGKEQQQDDKPADEEREKLERAGIASSPSGVWRSTAPTFKGGVQLAYAKPLLDGGRYGDGVSFPQAEGTWNFGGVHFRRVVVGFPEPVEVRF